LSVRTFTRVLFASLFFVFALSFKCFFCLYVEYPLDITGPEHMAHMIGLLRITSVCDGFQCQLMLEDVGMIAFLRWLQDIN
jgi:hypothetical protein